MKGDEELFAEVVEEFADAAAQFGAIPNDEELLQAALLEQKRKRKAELEQERRLRVRLARMRSEERVCTVCGRTFTVVLHARPGRVRERCWA
jgi:hypothetical protein